MPMYLLNTTTYELKRFDAESERPPYAILSHTWNKTEVSFTDLQKGPKSASRLPGWTKVERFCQIAKKDGYSWGWDDTCCINKSSSAEESEAINSMYAFYSSAKVCYVYLDDVRDPSKQNPRAIDSSFRDSRWFTRGWTLQELIAPKVIFFMSENWHRLGTKLSLAPTIQQITGVDHDVLIHKRSLGEVSVARRMSWASCRRTTRIEDRAYSLLGIFSVNMPAIYGEGAQGFVRLQLEIIRQSSDQSIFAWGRVHEYQVFLDNRTSLSNSHEWNLQFRCLLASSLDLFDGCGDVEPVSIEDLNNALGLSIEFPEFNLTNYGVQIHLPLYPIPSLNACFAVLACKHSLTGHFVTLLLCRKSGSPNGYWVGMYPLDRPLPHLHPYFRAFCIPTTTITSAQNLRVARMYLHSHNLNPQRSYAEGFAQNQLVRHAGSASPSSGPTRFRFIYQGWLLQKLRKLGFETMGWRNPKIAATGWTPMRLWHETEQDLSVTFETSKTAVVSHAAILFRERQRGLAFAITIGVLLDPKPDVWSAVFIKGWQDAGIDWQGDDHSVVKGIWERARVVVDDPRQLKHHTVGGTIGGLSFGEGQEGGTITIEFLPWLSQEEAVTVGKQTMTHVVDLVLNIWDVSLGGSAEEADSMSILASGRDTCNP
ncbi:heterokaryon incompatibility protein-domain-containing protein [Daedaleopsis nitida]|nr:heterokaryon incompatibility protein-domain-containing protein [Daedaleopsis nitida]